MYAHWEELNYGANAAPATGPWDLTGQKNFQGVEEFVIESSAAPPPHFYTPEPLAKFLPWLLPVRTLCSFIQSVLVLPPAPFY